jgi:hypothetical protein
LIAGALAPQPPDNLPETMIIRPSAPKPNAPTNRNPAAPADIIPKQPNQSNQPDNRLNKKSAFNTINSSVRTSAFYLGNKQHGNPPEPENAFLKTFSLGSGQNNPNESGKDVSAMNRNRTHVPSQPDTEDELAETIIVSPQKKDKDKK